MAVHVTVPAIAMLLAADFPAKAPALPTLGYLTGLPPLRRSKLQSVGVIIGASGGSQGGPFQELVSALVCFYAT